MLTRLTGSKGFFLPAPAPCLPAFWRNAEGCRTRRLCRALRKRFKQVWPVMPGTDWPKLDANSNFTKWDSGNTLLTIPSLRDIIHRLFLFAGRLRLLVHRQEIWCRKGSFAIKLCWSIFSAPHLFWPQLAWTFKAFVRGRALSRQSRLSLETAFSVIMWHNTRPLKVDRTIRHMNEHSFTFSLGFSPVSLGRRYQIISSRFATSTLEGLCG